MRVSLLQFAAAADSIANLQTIGRLVETALARAVRDRVEAELLVLPEAAMHDLGPPELALGPVAESLDGRFVSTLGGLAKRHGVTIVAGMFETSGDRGRPYNTVVALDESGEVRARYRKVHLYDSFGYRESDRLSAGDGELALLPVGGLTLGLQTCYDLRFPELSRTLVDRGADTLVVPAAWVRGPLKEHHWETLLTARAIENTCYVVGSGQCGRAYIGRSMIVDPMGVVVAGLGADEGIGSAEIDETAVEQARRINPSLANRRL